MQPLLAQRGKNARHGDMQLGNRELVQSRIDAVGLDASLHEPDLGVAYESIGVTDPAALRTEATAVMSAFRETHFHGFLTPEYGPDGDPDQLRKIAAAWDRIVAM